MIWLVFLIQIVFVYSSIENLDVRENTNVTINCSLNSSKFNPKENIILWYKDRTQVIGVNSISNNLKKYFLKQINDYTYQLIIYNIQLESSGLYRCQSFREKFEQFFQLNVLVPPTNLTFQSSHQLPVPDGSLITFNCTSKRVYPNPMFEWYKNGQLIQRSIGNQTFFSSSAILTLFLTPADHNHILRCQVSNQASTKEISIEIKLEVLFKPILKFSFNDKDLLTKNLSIIEQTSQRIRCKILSNPLISSKIEWFKNDQLMIGEHDEEMRINFTGIRKLTCRARNTLGESEQSLDINLLYKPKLILNENLTVIENDQVRLRCLIDSNPKCSQIRWLFNQDELSKRTCSNFYSEEYLIENITRLQSGLYTCEVWNQLNEHIQGISSSSVEVRVQYPPVILNKRRKVAVQEREEVKTECIVDGNPRAEIIWLGPNGQRLSAFKTDRILNHTIISSRLHLPSIYSSILGGYRCIAKNKLGQAEIPLEFQRPGLPDPPVDIEISNLTDSSLILTWQSGYNGGSNETFHITLIGNQTEEQTTQSNLIRFDDLTERTFYTIQIRSRNQFGWSNSSKMIRIQTKESSLKTEEFPLIQRAYFIPNTRRIRFQLGTIGSVFLDDLCVQAFNFEENSACIPLKSRELLSRGMDLRIKENNLRLKLCLLNQTDVCSKSSAILVDDQLGNDMSDWILILIGGIFGLCFVFILIILFICMHQHRDKLREKNSSTDTLKTTQSLPTVRVSDANTYSTQTRTLYYNDETAGIYSIQDRKNSVNLDSGMPSTSSTNSNSMVSQGFSSSDFYERSDGDYLVQGRILTPTKSCQQGKKLVYEVIV